MNWNSGYTVTLDNNGITYTARNKCAECGWVDNDPSFFTERDGELYCSLHIEKEGK